MIRVDTELESLGIESVYLDWSTGVHGTTVHRFVGRELIDIENLVRWAAAAGVRLGDVTVDDCAAAEDEASGDIVIARVA